MRTRLARRMVLAMLLCAIIMPTASSQAQDGVPHLISYQGRLTDPDGDPVPNADYSVVITIYSGSEEIIWQETHVPVTTTDGLFTVLLGAGDHTGYGPLDEAIFSEDERWLGIKVGDDPEMEPRTRFTSVPYSHRSKAGGGWTNNGNYVTLLSGSDSVGIGTDAPEASLDVIGTVYITDTLVIAPKANGGRAPGAPLQVLGPLQREWLDSEGRRRWRESIEEGLTIYDEDGVEVARVDLDGNATFQNIVTHGTSTHHGEETYYGVSRHWDVEYYYDGLEAGSSEKGGRIILRPDTDGLRWEESPGVDKFSVDNSGKAMVRGFQMPDTDVADGYVLTSDVSGNGTWQAPSSNSKAACADMVEGMTNSSSQVTITFPVTFDAPPYFSVTGLIKSGADAGQMAHVVVSSLTVSSVTVTIQYWTGVAFMGVGDSIEILLSYTAIEK